MTYRATLEIVITMHQLYLFNLRKQGQVRFKMNLFQKENSQLSQIKKNKKEEINQDQYNVYCNPYNIARKSDIIKPKHAQKNYHNSSNNLRNFQNSQNSQNGHSNVNNPNQKIYCNNSGIVNPFKQTTFPKQPTEGPNSQVHQINSKSEWGSTQSAIDYEGQSYYSKVFDTKYAQQFHKIEQSIFFKCYIPVDNMSSTSLMIKVQLLFSPEQQNMFKTLGSFKGKIRKLSPISSYLPISFDEFEGFTISSTYHTTIMQFKFQHIQQQQETKSLLNKKYEIFNNFQSYLHAATSNFRRAETKNFYFYYREFLERQLFDVQERHSDLIRVLNLTNILEYRFIKITSNSEILTILNGLPIFNNDRPLDKSVQNLLIQAFLQDFLQVKALIYEKWNNFVLFMTEYIDLITAHYRNNYQKNLKERFKSNLFSHKIEVKHDWTFSKYQDSGKKYEQMAENDRKKKKQEELWSQMFPIEDQNNFEDEKKFIKMFQEIYTVKRQRKLLPIVKKYNFSGNVITSSKFEQNNATQGLYQINGKHQQNLVPQYFQKVRPTNQKPSLSNIRKSSMVTLGQSEFSTNLKQKNIELGSGSVHRAQSLKQKAFQNPFIASNVGTNCKLIVQQANNDTKGQHLIILVHGYQASRQDFLILKLCLQIRFRAKVYISNANEGRTDDNVEAMGKRLAVELSRYFQNFQFTSNTRISFLGHSLGGVIIRSALGFLHNINQYLYTYISFSSPHLGYLYQPSRLVKAGLWFMNSWQGSKCLNQICMKDHQDLRQTYFFRLTENKALNSFKKIALISSSQDGYIPYQSARIQKNSDILFNKFGDQISRNVILEMVDNLIGQIEAEQISRINVIFHIEDRNMDSLIGRTAHIKYLSDLKFIKMFFIVFDKFFT